MTFLQSFVFTIVNFFMIWILTLSWYWYQGYENKLKKSIEYTVYITVFFSIYSYLFNAAWERNIRMNI